MTDNPHTWFLSDLASVPRNGLRVMSTFSCGGGSSMGYKLAGYDVVGANDIDAEMQSHYVRNLHPLNYFLCPIGDLLKRDLPNELFHLDVLDGSPPCSTFSMAGNREQDWGKSKHFREGQAKQVLSDLFFDYLDLIESLRPRVAVAENVKGMLLGNAKGYCKLIFERFREIGYRPQAFLINSADCGVPQRRERTFFCALRDNIDRPKLALKPCDPWVSAAEAIADVQDLMPEEIQQTLPAPSALHLWPHARPGEDFATVHLRLGEKGSQFNQAFFDGSVPAPTIHSQAGGHFYHWNSCRKFTLRELIRFSTFPEDYQFRSRHIGSYIMGMSVPPRMMRFVASEIAKQWLT
jgi:DNA (cytosine-5)-methyltransferase 1